MNKRIIITIVFVLVGMASFAQEKPGWIYSKPKPENNTYLYVVESATGSTELEARNQTFARVLQSTAMRLGQPINSDEINKAVQSGKSFEVISSQYNIPINKVCEYAEKTKEGYRVYVLCQVAKAGNVFADFDFGFNGCYDVKRYKDGSALLMSALIPGSGQFIKRYYGEGIITFLAEGGLAFCALLFHEQAKPYNDGPEKTLEYASIGTATALYVFNLYRAYTAKPKYKNGFALAPTAIPVGSDMAYGVSVSYKFSLLSTKKSK